MKCSNCENEIKEGQLYCDKCGYEVQIVPNFEPEVEHEIHATLTGVAENVRDIEEPVPKSTTYSFGKRILLQMHSKRGRLNIGIACLLVLCFFIAGITTFQSNNDQIQYEKATKAAEIKEYKKAIQYMKRAIELNANDVNRNLLLADYYYKNGEKENATITLLNCIESFDENAEAYRRVIEIYKGDKQYEKINELLLKCKNDETLSQFKEFTAFPPEFSLTEEYYNEKVSLVLKSDVPGTIYYTLDGTEPSKISMEYSIPVELEYGSYIIKAVFVNQYGIMSDCAEKSILIESTTPLQPVVEPYSGAYNSPQMITVDNADMGSVHFTIDGSDPTQNSEKYTGSITMPLGTSRFKFITFGEDGTASEVTERIYDLKLNHVKVSAQDSINITTMFLLQNNYLTDTEGHNTTGTGRYIYSCTTAISKNTSTYYLVTENNLDENENYTQTGNIFTVDAMTGAMGRAEIARDGTINVILY
ncbi:MAG: chitobiase/beta-hexosaminidase C-terminal domain-containing protein [Lachnospiraceae bacterium]|nr:chitobiase/beta-hexosaminidase C-terminal domain-containing protein [Lachnospiraceae bacterium]